MTPDLGYDYYRRVQEEEGRRSHWDVRGKIVGPERKSDGPKSILKCNYW